MAIRIKPIKDHVSYEVNGKTIIKDQNGKWISAYELTQDESNAFANYRKAVIENPAFNKHTSATYKAK